MNDEIGIGCATEATVVERVVFDKPVVVHAALTNYEQMIFNRLMQSEGEVVSKDQLTNVIYPCYDAEAGDKPSSNTIEVFIGRLRRKIGEKRITTLRGRGYRLEKRPA